MVCNRNDMQQGMIPLQRLIFEIHPATGSTSTHGTCSPFPIRLGAIDVKTKIFWRLCSVRFTHNHPTTEKKNVHGMIHLHHFIFETFALPTLRC